jgi:hypothetical protein
MDILFLSFFRNTSSKLHKSVAALLIYFILFFALIVRLNYASEANPELLDVNVIWDDAPHNAFTDLIRFDNKWICTFREGEGHAHGQDGQIRILMSKDANSWESIAILDEPGIDLRDPKLSITPDNRLMLLAGGSVYEDEFKDGRVTVNTRLKTRQSRVAFSENGWQWTDWQPILWKDEWLWRVTWHQDHAYGVSRDMHSIRRLITARLMGTKDGIHYNIIKNFNVPDHPNEATVRFLKDSTMIILMRRDAGNTHAWIGKSSHPYRNWSWNESNYRIGGPNFIVLPSGEMWAAGRLYGDDGTKTVLARFGPDMYDPVLTLPSSGDTSYPGLVWYNDILWMSYYSSHDGKASIYLAKIKINKDKK